METDTFFSGVFKNPGGLWFLIFFFLSFYFCLLSDMHMCMLCTEVEAIMKVQFQETILAMLGSKENDSE